MLREVPEDLVNSKDEDFVPGQEPSKQAENIVGIWKEQIEQVRLVLLFSFKRIIIIFYVSK